VLDTNKFIPNGFVYIKIDYIYSSAKILITKIIGDWDTAAGIRRIKMFFWGRSEQGSYSC